LLLGVTLGFPRFGDECYSQALLTDLGEFSCQRQNLVFGRLLLVRGRPPVRRTLDSDVDAAGQLSARRRKSECERARAIGLQKDIIRAHFFSALCSRIVVLVLVQKSGDLSS
jgi:hypothetical protein